MTKDILKCVKEQKCFAASASGDEDESLLSDAALQQIEVVLSKLKFRSNVENAHDLEKQIGTSARKLAVLVSV